VPYDLFLKLLLLNDYLRLAGGYYCTSLEKVVRLIFALLYRTNIIRKKQSALCVLICTTITSLYQVCSESWQDKAVWKGVEGNSTIIYIRRRDGCFLLRSQLLWLGDPPIRNSVIQFMGHSVNKLHCLIRGFGSENRRPVITDTYEPSQSPGQAYFYCI
jgi:hypothetical protein